jgi:hypothetical protein
MMDIQKTLLGLLSDVSVQRGRLILAKRGLPVKAEWEIIKKLAPCQWGFYAQKWRKGVNSDIDFMMGYFHFSTIIFDAGSYTRSDSVLQADSLVVNGHLFRYPEPDIQLHVSQCQIGPDGSMTSSYGLLNFYDTNITGHTENITGFSEIWLTGNTTVAAKSVFMVAVYCYPESGMDSTYHFGEGCVFYDKFTMEIFGEGNFSVVFDGYAVFHSDIAANSGDVTGNFVLGGGNDQVVSGVTSVVIDKTEPLIHSDLN